MVKHTAKAAAPATPQFRRFDPNQHPAPKAKPKAKQQGNRPWLWLDSNLMNYPWARDARTAVKWKRSQRDGIRGAELPNEWRIWLSLPLDVSDEHCHAPTGFDMNVLYFVLSQVQRTKSAHIKPGSISAILTALDLTINSDNRARVKDSLRYWTTLWVSYEDKDGKGCWYVANKGSRSKLHGGKHIKHELRPPITLLNIGSHSISLRIHEQWVKLALHKGRFNVKVPLPLPYNAAEQAPVLMVLTSKAKHLPPTAAELAAGTYDSNELLYQRGSSEFARKCGLSCHHRKKRLTAALDGAVEWFKKAEGGLDYILGPYGTKIPQGKLVFVRTMPKPRHHSAVNAEQTDSPKRAYPTVRNVPISDAKSDWNVPTSDAKTDCNVPTIRRYKVEGSKTLKQEIDSVRKDGAAAPKERFASFSQEESEGLQEDYLGDSDYPGNEEDEGLLEATPGCCAGDEPDWAWGEPTRGKSKPRRGYD